MNEKKIVTSTPYDDVFRTLLNDCSSLIIPVINTVFQENYTGDEEVVLSLLLEKGKLGKEWNSIMGIYLNGKNAYGLFQETFLMTYFVDKTDILNELVQILEFKKNVPEKEGDFRGKNPKYVCITRPRRFGKTIMANMIASFFGKGVDSSETFESLKASGFPWYKRHLNTHNVIHIMFNELPDEAGTYEQYIYRIKGVLMDRFSDMVRREPSLGNVYRLAKESGRMLRATKVGDTKTMAEILQYVHNTESPLLVYSNEAELASMIKWVYLQAIDYYRIEREDKAGVGYVDYIFYPFRRDDDAIIIELKVDHTADEAIRQIRERQYAFRFEGKIGEKPEYTGRILAVGIAYSRNDKSKRHECKVEVLRERVE